MKFLRFISRGSWGLATMAMVAGFLSGACNTLLIALINAVISRGTQVTAGLMLAFVALMLAKNGGNALSQLALVHFSQRTLAALSRELSRRVLATPLLRLEALGPPRILTGLIDDVAMIGWAIQNVPT